MNGADLSILIKKHPIVVTCTLVSLISGVVFYYQGDTLEDLKSQVVDKAKQSQTVQSNVRNSVGLPQHVEGIQKATKQLESRLLKASQLATNLQYFYRLESETGVKITDVRQNQLGRSSGGALFVGVPYTVTFQGSFKNVMEFMQRIESGKHLSKFSTVSFSKAAGAEPQNGLLSVSMNIELLGTP
jgi:hypothetical protein